MAAVAELRLFLSKEALRQPSILLRNTRSVREMRLGKRRRYFVYHVCCVDQMSGMTILTCDAEQFVFGSLKQRLVVTRDVAVHASAGVLVRFSPKPEDQVSCFRELLIIAARSFD